MATSPKKSRSKAEEPRDSVAKLIRVPRGLMDKIEARQAKEEFELKSRRAGNFTSLTLALLEAWAEGRVDPWKR